MKILPDVIPADTAPLDGTSILADAVTTKRTPLVEGKNMFVALFTGEFKVGRVEWVNTTHFTVGTSDPIHVSQIETAREV